MVLRVGLKKQDGSVQSVALKRPKCNWDVEQYRTLYKEICLMTYLGRHSNIVNMIGCVINIASGQLYMVMELCGDGTLLNLLQSLREPNRFHSELHKSTDGDNVSDVEQSYIQEVFPHWQSIKATMNDCRFHSDLISFAYQVASGMEYLASIQFVHRDLAARNVLLSDNFKIAKIGDFGLSHQMYCEQNYYNEREDKIILPRRSSAPESFLNREFSTGSDVWSFGVVVGEIFSLGEVPFAHVSNEHFDPSKLQTGEIRLQHPQLATGRLYQLMLDCCRPNRKDRISFTEAKHQLAQEFRRCSPQQFDQLEAKLNELQLEIASDESPSSMFHAYQPKSTRNIYTKEPRNSKLSTESESEKSATRPNLKRKPSGAANGTEMS